MQIAIDASRTTRPRLTGTERYALEIIRALIRVNEEIDSPHDLFLYFNQPPPPGLFPQSPYVEHIVISLPRLWTHIRFAHVLWTQPRDVVWVPAHGLPFLFPGKASVTIHDLGYKPFPQAHSWHQRLALEVYTRYSAYRSDLIMADSKATRDDLHRYYNIPLEKIRVVYPGVDIPNVGDVDTVRAKYALPARYWLYLGTLQPRKNIAMLTAAYQQWRSQHPDDGAALVLAGGKGWKYDPQWAQGKGVILTGFVDETDKGALYAGALALLFPSLYEGFGFPVVEAMGVGTPVICSDTSSLPELGGEAALYVQPDDAASLVRQMNRLLSQQGLREQLIAKGQAQSRKFNWHDAAWDALLTLEAAERRYETY